MRSAVRPAPCEAVPFSPVVGSVASAMADRIISQFNTWAFKRQQPARPELMSAVVAGQVSQGRPINFILYWGKGPRHSAAAPDAQCLDYMATMMQRIASVYAPGARGVLIQTDTHARLNGHAETSINAYYSEIDRLARQRGMETRRLSEIVAHYRGAPAPAPENEAALLATLTRSAGRWYRGTGTPDDGARRYLAMNLLEKRAVEQFAPDAIFVTFNGSDLDALFPDHLAIFYMYALRRGSAVKPWFLDAEGKACEGAG